MGTGYIYMLINKINGKKYIGQTNNLRKRIKYQHFKEDYGCNVIDKAIRKYGKENFEVEILEEIKIEKLDKREKYWIKEHNTYEGEGYNCTPGGKSLRGKDNPMYGVSLSGEKNGMYGKERSEEVKERLREFHTGFKYSEETKRKHSENNTGSGNPNAKIKFGDVYKIIKLYFEEDKLGVEIAKEYDVNKNVIYQILNCKHWTMKDLPEVDSKYGRVVIDKKTGKEIYKKYHNQNNITQKDLSKEYNVSRTTITNICNKKHHSTKTFDEV